MDKIMEQLFPGLKKSIENKAVLDVFLKDQIQVLQDKKHSQYDRKDSHQYLGRLNMKPAAKQLDIPFLHGFGRICYRTDKGKDHRHR